MGFVVVGGGGVALEVILDLFTIFWFFSFRFFFFLTMDSLLSGVCISWSRSLAMPVSSCRRILRKWHCQVCLIYRMLKKGILWGPLLRSVTHFSCEGRKEAYRLFGSDGCPVVDLMVLVGAGNLPDKQPWMWNNWLGECCVNSDKNCWIVRMHISFSE